MRPLRRGVGVLLEVELAPLPGHASEARRHSRLEPLHTNAELIHFTIKNGLAEL